MIFWATVFLTILVVALLINFGMMQWKNIMKIKYIFKQKVDNDRWIMGIQLATKVTIYICVFFLILVLVIYRNTLVNNKYIKFLFVTPKGFNWVGVTSLVALISFTFTAWDSRRKINADLISKSRVQWIKEVRNMTAVMVTNAIYLTSVLPQEVDEDSAKRLRDSSTTLLEKATLIKLYFPVNDSDGRNKDLVDMVIQVEDEISKYTNFINEEYPKLDKAKIATKFGNIQKIMLDDINELRDAVAVYTKEEWEKAKHGK
ncbi:hypothetical protein [Latilactobacillus sakei]|uniref:hypothetical protein n=1 Tax=Latilactobacillus sakei TaxID=1599 RepID=UPI0020C75C8D|nr:hypothetical protein [Latilactobacillus sakei]MCP8850831.1 hypothetical protein [Latilactobacillus sakei]